MRTIAAYPLKKSQAALWFLGQAGYVMRSGGVTLVIDPYLSDSAAKVLPELSRAIPVPIAPDDLRADIFIVTHDHLDHLDPETVGAYRHKEATSFVAPRLACRKLRTLGVPERNIVRVDSGEEANLRGVSVLGVYAVPSAPDAIDTTGYRLKFANGRSVYHTADTGFAPLLLRGAPKAEVLLTCINGKWGNLGPEEAAELAVAVAPKVAIPNHYDVMAINAECPETFVFLLGQKAPRIEARVLRPLEPFVW